MEVLLKKEKPMAAAEIRDECFQLSNHELINSALRTLLDSTKDIDCAETIEWCRWIVAGGLTPEKFSATVRRYDKATACNTIWTADCFAYRCRTCVISECMSLCTECFHEGNHEGHDWIMFRSETGGACDCGDTNVVKICGCCTKHTPSITEGPSHNTLQYRTPNPSSVKTLNDPLFKNCGDKTIPPELLCVANEMMPHLYLRLIQHMRLQEPPTSVSSDGRRGGLGAGRFIGMLKGMSEMGTAMREVMTSSLTNPQIYKNLTQGRNVCRNKLEREIQKKYIQSIKSIPVLSIPAEFQDIVILNNALEHTTFLEELIFWTAKFEFPENLICLLLSLRRDNCYMEAFAKAFVLHYGLICQLFLKSHNPEVFSKRVVNVSVHIFSVEHLSLLMVESMQLLHIILLSLKQMIHSNTVPVETTISKDSSGIPSFSSLRIVDCDKDTMSNNCYASLKSDLNKILSHTSVAEKLLEDNMLLKQWFQLISFFQGMNPNKKIESVDSHMEFEPSTYISSITAELEICSTIMWALLSHMKDDSTAHLNKNLITHCWKQLRHWTMSSVFCDKDQVSFHLPLHRCFSRFIHQGVTKQNLNLKDVLPPAKELMMTLEAVVKLQVTFYEIVSGEWVRNGNQILRQASNYIGSMCCNSMVDADIFLLQISLMNLPQEDFLNNIIHEFKVAETISSLHDDPELPHEVFLAKTAVIENFFNFLAIITTVRTNLGMSEEDLLALELTTLLSKEDTMHSQLMDLMPDRCGHDNGSQADSFESVLAQVADFQAPKFEQGGNRTQGTYIPKSSTWLNLYDPIYVLLRSSDKCEFQKSRDRFMDHLRKSKMWDGTGNLWPPFRIPKAPPPAFFDVRKLLHSKIIHQVIFSVLSLAIRSKKLCENVLALAIYLLEIGLSSYDNEIDSKSSIFTNYINFELAQENCPEDLENNIFAVLLRLHSHLSGRINSYSYSSDTSDKMKPRIGDGAFFISNFLDKLCTASEACKMEIERLKNKFWPQEELNKEDLEREILGKEKEELRRRIKERKMQLISQYSKKGQMFLQCVAETEASDGDMSTKSKSSTPDDERTYVCVICRETNANNCEDNPFGLVTFLNPSKVIGNRQISQEMAEHHRVSMKCYKDAGEDKMNEYMKHFDKSSVLMSVDGGYNGGVFVQTCGHYLHMNCLNSYLDSLNPNEKKKKLKPNVSKRDYRCPLCRKLANSFVPLIQANHNNKNVKEVNCEVSNLLRKRNNNLLDQNVLQSVNQFTNELKAVYSQIVPLPDFTSGYAFAFFLASTLNYNLEIETSFRHCNSDQSSIQAISKSPPTSSLSKSIPPLLSILQVNYKSLSVGHGRHLAKLWEGCCGTRSFRNSKEVPILLRDSQFLLLQFVLQLPADISIEVYTKVVQCLFNVTVIQVLCKILVSITENDRKNIVMKYLPTELHLYMGIILSQLGNTSAFTCKDIEDPIATVDINTHVLKMLLPFLRMAVLLKHHIFQEVYIENCSSYEEEFKNLAQELYLGSRSESGESFSPSLKTQFNNSSCEYCVVKAEDFLSWNSDANKIISCWCQHLSDYLLISDQPNFLIETLNISWGMPRLIELSKEYDKLFQFYLNVRCKTCNTIPTDPNICLVCGTLVCMKSSCCQSQNSGMFEVVEHSLICGAGTAVFLSTQTSCITVVRGRKACSWGSVYLDSYGEEDPGLKRGKPLFLCHEGYSLLQKLWLTHAFEDNTSGRWFWHRDLL